MLQVPSGMSSAIDQQVVARTRIAFLLKVLAKIWLQGGERLSPLTGRTDISV
jgi:hypothetical protein